MSSNTWMPARRPLRRRSHALCVAFVICTIGLYSFYWLHRTHLEHPRREGIDPRAWTASLLLFIPIALGVTLLNASGISGTPGRGFQAASLDARMCFAVGLGFCVVAHASYAFVTYRLAQRLELLAPRVLQDWDAYLLLRYGAMAALATSLLVLLLTLPNHGVAGFPPWTKYARHVLNGAAIGLAWAWWSRAQRVSNHLADQREVARRMKLRSRAR